MKKRKVTEKLIIILIVLIVGVLGFKGINALVDKNKTQVLDKPEEKIDDKVDSSDIDVDSINYEDYKNYLEENLDRYKKYNLAHPELTADEVIWRVNRGLDVAFYDDVKVIEKPSDVAVIVNKYYQFNADYVPQELVEVSPGVMARSDATEAFKALSDAAEKAGFPIHALVGYRSYQDQETLYNEQVEALTQEIADTKFARPGHSEHQTGLAFDIAELNVKSEEENTGFASTETYEWVYDNAHRFGFIFSYRDGCDEITGYEGQPWHIRYVGEDIALDMKEDSIRSLEEFMAKGGLKDKQ